MNPNSDLELLIRSRYPVVVVESMEEGRVRSLLRRTSARLGAPFFVWSVTAGLTRLGAEQAVYDTTDPAKALSNVAAFKGQGIYYFKDLQAFLDQPAVMRRVLDLVEPFSRDCRALVMSGNGTQLPAQLRPFSAVYRLELPDRAELARHTRNTLGRLGSERDVMVKLTPVELRRLVESLSGLTLFEAERALEGAAADDDAVTGADIPRVSSMRRDRLAGDGLLEMIDIDPQEPEPGGLENLREWVRKRGAALGREAVELGLDPPRGVLLTGVQGCGKTLAARFIARSWDLPLARLDIGSIYDKYIGESEHRLERALQVAERLAPCVLLVDEIEKALAAGRDASADAGLSQRILARMLGWLQDHESPVFVVATCNAIESLPPELMRKGRFDEVFFVDLPDATARRAILAAHLRSRGQEPDTFDLGGLATLTKGFSGAEIEQAVIAARYSAFADREGLANRHLVAEVRATRPLSVVRAEAIEDLRRWALGRAVPAGRATAA